MARYFNYNKDFTSPYYVHSHIRTFEKTVKHAFDTKMVSSYLESNLDSMNERVATLVQILKSYVDEAEVKLGAGGLLSLATGNLFQQFRDAKTTWITQSKKMPDKAELVGKVAAALDRANLKAENLLVGEFIDLLIPIYEEDAAAEVEKVVIENFLKMDVVGSPAQIKATRLTDIQPGGLIEKNRNKFLDIILRRTLKWEKDRVAFVDKKYKEDTEQLRSFIKALNSGLSAMQTTEFNIEHIRKYLSPYLTNLYNMKGGGADYSSYDRGAYKGLLSFVNTQMGFLLEAVVAIGMEHSLHRTLGVQGNTVTIASMGDQAKVTSDVVAQIANVNVPVGVSVKSNLKRTFQHDVNILNNASLFPTADADLPNKLIYFLVNYTNLAKWSVEENEGFNLFKSDQNPRNMSGETISLYDKYMELIERNSTIQALLGALFVDIPLETDITKTLNQQKQSLPLILQIYNEAYYMHNILKRVNEVGRGGGSGFNMYLMQTNVKPSMKDLWSYKYNFIRSKGARYFGGYPTLKKVVESGGFLPSGDLRARVIIQMDQLFQ